MDGTGPEAGSLVRTEPQEAARASRWEAFRRGIRETPLTPMLVLCFSFIGFGALTKETGLSLLHTLFMSVFIFALPGQVVLVDEMARGASLFAAAFAVTATAVRLLPLTVALLPIIRDRSGPKWLEFATTCFIAVTLWTEAMRRSPQQLRWERTAYTLGIAVLLVISCSTGAVIGFLLAASLPKTFAGALLFLTPMYFLLSMIASSRGKAEILSIVAGLALGPILHLAVPQWDLLLTGIIGGTLSFLAARWLQAKRRA
jgi:predicted branched-subunit amino acid permease